MVKKPKSGYVYSVRLGEGVTTIGGKLQWSGSRVLYNKKSDAERHAKSRETKIFTKSTGRTQVIRPRVVRISRKKVSGSHIN